MTVPKEIWEIWKLPKGIILIWSGLIAAIPKGWHLCDGAENTPDLQNYFVPGAGDSYNPHDEGGFYFHRHLFSSDLHMHYIPTGYPMLFGSDFANWTVMTILHGETVLHHNMPSYHGLAYIMKL